MICQHCKRDIDHGCTHKPLHDEIVLLRDGVALRAFEAGGPGIFLVEAFKGTATLNSRRTLQWNKPEAVQLAHRLIDQDPAAVAAILDIFHDFRVQITRDYQQVIHATFDGKTIRVDEKEKE